MQLEVPQLLRQAAVQSRDAPYPKCACRWVHKTGVLQMPPFLLCTCFAVPNVHVLCTCAQVHLTLQAEHKSVCVLARQQLAVDLGRVSLVHVTVKCGPDI